MDLHSDGSIVSTAGTLVQPGIPVSPAASAIHHLIDADLKAAPALADVVQRFVGADAYVAAMILRYVASVAHPIYDHAALDGCCKESSPPIF